MTGHVHEAIGFLCDSLLRCVFRGHQRARRLPGQDDSLRRSVSRRRLHRYRRALVAERLGKKLGRQSLSTISLALTA